MDVLVELYETAARFGNTALMMISLLAAVIGAVASFGVILLFERKQNSAATILASTSAVLFTGLVILGFSAPQFATQGVVNATVQKLKSDYNLELNTQEVKALLNDDNEAVVVGFKGVEMLLTLEQNNQGEWLLFVGGKAIQPIENN